MAAVELMAVPAVERRSAPSLRLVANAEMSRPYLTGPLVAHRRAARARMMQRRRRTIAVAVVAVALVMLAFPGLAFGSSNTSGLSIDLQTGSQLSAGMVYVVQPGDTVMTIAKQVNPVTPNVAYRALVHELHATSVVVGENVLIP